MMVEHEAIRCLRNHVISVWRPKAMIHDPVGDQMGLTKIKA